MFNVVLTLLIILILVPIAVCLCAIVDNKYEGTSKNWSDNKDNKKEDVDDE